MLDKITLRVYNTNTRSFQIVANIDFNNQTIDTYGDDEPIYNIHFSDVSLSNITFMTEDDVNEVNL